MAGCASGRPARRVRVTTNGGWDKNPVSAVKPSSKKGVCAFCRFEQYLCWSHLLPRSLYRLTRNPRHNNANPVILRKENLMHSSFQVAQYLLCTQCETRFQQRGEDWMMRNCYRGKGVFRLKDELTSVSPVVSLGPDRIYHAARTPKLEITKLAYFASSVFWRASVPLNFDGKEPVVPVSLGEKYGDEFRSYLLGLSEFPIHASLNVVISGHPKPFLQASVPAAKRTTSFHVYQFFIPRLLF